MGLSKDKCIYKNDIPVHWPLIKGFMNTLILLHVLTLIWSQWILKGIYGEKLQKYSLISKCRITGSLGNALVRRLGGQQQASCTQTWSSFTLCTCQHSYEWTMYELLPGLPQWFYIHRLNWNYFKKMDGRLLWCK